jgi:hypothetical protein|tara:strand:- start:366 stop:725 length:360 start_codon:yes stop_codon:yes gene_type:complete
MATMQEEMAKVDYAECNDWEKNFYDSQKDGTYTPSPKQMGIINKMPKLANGSTPPQADTSFNYGANKPEPTRVSDDSVDDMIHKLGVIVEKLSQFNWYNQLPPDAQQKHATTIFLSMRK